MEQIELNNISFSYGDIQVFNDISIKIKKGRNTIILGNIASGKTTLTNILNNKVSFNGEYLINGNKATKKNIGSVICLSNTDKYDNKKVIDLFFDKFGENKKDDIKELVSYFKINDYLNNKISELTYDLKYYILIILNILDKNKYLVLDNILCYLSNNHSKKIYSYSKKNKVTIVNISSSLDNALHSEYLVCLYNGKIAMEGPVMSCLKEERLLKRLGFKLPFMYDLSLQLNYYEVLDDIYLDFKDMESAIWK